MSKKFNIACRCAASLLLLALTPKPAGYKFTEAAAHIYTWGTSVASDEQGGATSADVESAIQAAAAITPNSVGITEFNGQNGPNGDPTTQAQIITAEMQTFQDLANQGYNIKNADAYMLLDDPNMPLGSDGENMFGLMTSTGQPTAASQAYQAIATA